MAYQISIKATLGLDTETKSFDSFEGIVEYLWEFIVNKDLKTAKGEKDAEAYFLPVISIRVPGSALTVRSMAQAKAELKRIEEQLGDPESTIQDKADRLRGKSKAPAPEAPKPIEPVPSAPVPVESPSNPPARRGRR